jgi:hypothetical protein
MAHLTGPVAYPQQTSEVKGTSALPIPVGTRARDASGNEFVYVDYTSARAIGEVVLINPDFTATACGATSVGPVGIVCGTATSDSAGWVQVYGYNRQILGAPTLIAGACSVGATTAVNAVAMSVLVVAELKGTTGDGQVVQGLIITTAASTSGLTSDGTSRPTSAHGYAFGQLNYPFVGGNGMSSA